MTAPKRAPVKLHSKAASEKLHRVLLSVARAWPPFCATETRWGKLILVLIQTVGMQDGYAAVL